jgi:hypothetical protein
VVRFEVAAVALTWVLAYPVGSVGPGPPAALVPFAPVKTIWPGSAWLIADGLAPAVVALPRGR